MTRTPDQNCAMCCGSGRVAGFGIMPGATMECDCVRNGPSTASKIEARTTILPLEAQDLPSLDELEDILYPNVRGYDDLGFEFTIRGYTYRVVEDRPKGFEVATAAHLGCFGGWIRTDMKSHLLGDKWFVARMIGAA